RPACAAPPVDARRHHPAPRVGPGRHAGPVRHAGVLPVRATGGRDVVTLSVSIMAHPARAGFVSELAARLDDAPVAWDTDGVRWHTGRRAWELHDPTADWHLVVQDD